MRVADLRRRFRWSLLAAIPTLCLSWASSPPQSEARLPAIYSPDPQDCWNRIFRALFTRTVTARVTNEYPEGAPFAGTAGFQHIPVSKKSFERLELGDRAIEPLYPSFLSIAGTAQVLTGPKYVELKQALQEALAEEKQRSPLARALMQSDAWAAYDLVYRYPICRACTGMMRARTADEYIAADRRDEILALLAKYLKKLALTAAEIRRLPSDYSFGLSALPPVFDGKSGWIEIQWPPDRSHDADAGYRRAARVFVKPAVPPADKDAFVARLREPGDVTARFDQLALVIENLLLDADGNVVPSPITYDVQVRKFVKDSSGKFVRTEAEEHELSRARMLSDPAEGLVRVRAEDPAYLSVAGNDYGFATPQLQPGRGLPVLGTLNSRCASCHFTGAGAIFTLSVVSPKKLPPPKSLPIDQDLRASYVAQKKMQRPDYMSLRAAWGR